MKFAYLRWNLLTLLTNSLRKLVILVIVGHLDIIGKCVGCRRQSSGWTFCEVTCPPALFESPRDKYTIFVSCIHPQAEALVPILIGHQQLQKTWFIVIWQEQALCTVVHSYYPRKCATSLLGLWHQRFHVQLLSAKPTTLLWDCVVDWPNALVFRTSFQPDSCGKCELRW